MGFNGNLYFSSAADYNDPGWSYLKSLFHQIDSVHAAHEDVTNH